MEHAYASGDPDDPWADEPGLVADMRWLGELAARLVADPGLVDDACQEAWLGASRTTAGVPGRADLLRGFRRFLHRHWRGERRRRVREQDVASTEAQPSVEDLLVQSEQQQRVWKALVELEEPFRSTLLLRFQAGLSNPLIAARLGVAEDTVRWRSRRGIEVLRRRLAADEERGGLQAVLAAIPAAVRGPDRAAVHSVAGAPSLVSFPSLIGALLMAKITLVLSIAAVVAIVCVAVLDADDRNADQPEPFAPAFAKPAAASKTAAVSAPARMVPEDVAARVAVVQAAPTPEELLAALRRADPDPWVEPVVRLHLTSGGAERLPGEVSVLVTPYLPDSGIAGRTIGATCALEEGLVELPLGADGSTYGYASAVIEVSAAGFGRQETEHMELSWEEGGITEVSLELMPATSVDVIAVRSATGEPLEDVRFWLQGPSARFGATQYSKAGGIVRLDLEPASAAEDTLYARGAGTALHEWPTREVLSLPVLQDGARHLELSSGCLLRGSIAMETGLPIPEGTELRYRLRRAQGRNAREYPHGLAPAGQVSISEDGRFEIEALPPGLLLIHLREKSRSIRAPQMSPDFLVEIPRAEVMEASLVVPDELQVVTLDLSWGDRDCLLFADLLRPTDPDDGPYAEGPSARALVAQRHWFSSGEETRILLPAGSLVEGQHYILRIGLDLDLRIERTITFQGDTPRIEHTFGEEAQSEHPPMGRGSSRLPAELDARSRSAREAGARIVLRATSG